MDEKVSAQAHAIEAAQQQYERTGNPILVWDAYSRSRQNGLPIPSWVLAYLDDAAQRLGALAVRAQSGEKVAPAKDVLAAFGMGGKRGEETKFKGFAQEWLGGTWVEEWRDIGARVAAYLKEGDKETIAIENVRRDLARERAAAVLADVPHAERPPVPAESTVRRAWKQFRKECPDGQQFHQIPD